MPKFTPKAPNALNPKTFALPKPAPKNAPPKFPPKGKAK